MIERVHIGLPRWGLKDWIGVLYRRGSRPVDFLRQYAGVFNAVEGNTTFYSLPSIDTVERWRDATPPEFRFCFKFPKRVTHELGLRHADAPTAEFLQRLAPLGERLGPFMLQLPATFGPARIGRLERFVADLPPEFRYAVELRHAAFVSGEGERRVNELLARHRCDRVLMDTRPMRSGDPTHPDVVEAAHDKADLPVHTVVTGDSPFVRFVGHPEPLTNEPWIERWCDHVAAWIESGKAPYVFVHAPDNRVAPALARRFHARLRERVAVGEIGRFPGTADGDQLRLV